MSDLALTAPRPVVKDRPRPTEIADPARVLARDIGRNVGRILAALQIGDITRQRAEHVQSGLSLLDCVDQSAYHLALRSAGERLLEAQLEAALREYNEGVCKLLPSIEGLASDAVALAALSEFVTELGDRGQGLRDLKRRMDAAIQIIAEIQAADGAARYLSARLTNGPDAVADAATPPSGQHPLGRKASELLTRIVYLEAAVDNCVVILQRLKDASEALAADGTETSQTDASLDAQSQSQKRFAAATKTIKAIREKAVDDIAAQAGKTKDLPRLLDHASDADASHPPRDPFAASLNFKVPAHGPDEEAFRGELNALLSKIDSLYAMGQERDVHRAVCKAWGLEVVEEPDELEDGLF